MISKCELVFFFLFSEWIRMRGTCWSRLFLAHFTTLFRMVTKSSVKQILFPWQDTWYLNRLLQSFLYAKTITKCWCSVGMFFDRYTNFKFIKLVSRRDHLNISTMYSVFWLKRIFNIIIQAGIFREYRNKCFWRPKAQAGIFREYRNKCFWRPKCFGKGTTSDYAVCGY